MKRVLIKASEIIPQSGKYIAGIGRTNIELINSLLTINDPDLELAVYCPTRHSIGFDHYGWPVKYYAYPLPHKPLLKLNIESKYRRLFMRNDLLHLTHNFDNLSKRENVVVTIHDMYMLNDENRWLFEKCAHLSQAIATCSEYSKTDIVEKLGVSPEKIAVIPWGIDHNNFNIKSDDEISLIKKRFIIPQRYFFACSCANPRKNADALLEAFAIFAPQHPDVSLVMAWGNAPEQIRQKYARLIGNRQVILLPFVDDNELAILYSGALASYFVSSFEGFGFPILESMACGTPVVTCRNSSLSEVGGDLAIYTRERDIEELVASMEQLAVTDKPDPSPLLAHAAKYDWHATAQQYINFYKNALQ